MSPVGVAVVDAATIRRAVIDTAAARYLAAGHFARHFARGKLAGDPAFTALLAHGWIADRARVLDLGCGQGLLAAWLLAAEQVKAQGRWPVSWPAPPANVFVRGIELMPADVRRANSALGHRAHIERGDIRTASFGHADAVVILDVLQYMDIADQDAVLRRARAALAPGGSLLLRTADAAGGLGFHIGRWVDRIATVARGHRAGPLYYRRLDDWQLALEGLGFSIERHPMSAGTPFANVLLRGRLTDALSGE